MSHSELERQLVKQQYQLAEAVISLSKGTELRPILEQVGEISRELTDARYAMLSYIENGEKKYIPLGLTARELEALGSNWPKGIGLLGLMWTKHEVVRVNNIGSHSESSGFPEGHPSMTTMLGAPIMFGDEVQGVIYLTEKRGGRGFTAIDETIVRTLASACAVAIANANHVKNLTGRIEELEAKLAAKK